MTQQQKTLYQFVVDEIKAAQRLIKQNDIEAAKYHARKAVNAVIGASDEDREVLSVLTSAWGI